MVDVKNPFTPKWAAARYAAFRPNVHRRVMEWVRERVGEGTPLGVDIGCGTGRSSVALASLCEGVIGVDTSAEMLGAAEIHERVSYVRAEGEALPLTGSAFDIATIGCASHWCDRERLFGEVRRVLRPRGWLVVYDNGFAGAADPSAEFARWHKEVYQKAFPAPPRHPLFEPDMVPAGSFEVVTSEILEERYSFTRRRLAGYLTTQSNVVDAVAGGETTIEEVDTRLARELPPLFGEEPGEPAGRTMAFRFGGRVTVLRVTG
jgi:SAM-dependent methyltransferase